MIIFTELITNSLTNDNNELVRKIVKQNLQMSEMSSYFLSKSQVIDFREMAKSAQFPRQGVK